jgi:hypothetical protein
LGQAQALPVFRGRNYRFGIENQRLALASGIAAHHAIGERLGLPVHTLIGGKVRQRMAVYASGGSMTVDPRACLDAMQERFLGGGLLRGEDQDRPIGRRGCGQRCSRALGSGLID